MSNSNIILLCFFAYIVISSLLSILYFRRVILMRKLNSELTDLLSIRQELNQSTAENKNLTNTVSSLRSQLKPLQNLPTTLDELKKHTSNLAGKVNYYETRFSNQISVEEQLQKAKQDGNIEIRKLINEIRDLKNKRIKFTNDIEEKNSEIKQLNSDLASLKLEHDLFLDGYKEPVFSLEDHPAYVFAIKKLRQRQKDMIRKKEAIVCHTEWEVSGSKRDGKTAINRLIRLTLRAFNNECDLMIKNLTWKNAERTKEKIWRLSEILDGLNESMHVNITTRYIGLKIEEVDLVNEEKLKREEEKEKLRAQREIEREEAKAQREYMAEVKRQERLEKDKQNALKAARERLIIASAEHREAVEKEIEQIEVELSEAILAKGKMLSMAEQTRIGHVYIISNRGSFGDRIVKIGMTRRLEPMDRVKELGDASVPFPFDVHAIIFSEDAPSLEKELHQTFQESRVNKVNNRKEFFYAEIDELERIIKKKIPDIPFERSASSKEYIQSISNNIH